MGWWKAILGAGCVAPLSGCNLFHLAAHNIYNEPVQYADECDLDTRLREEARLAWREVCRQYPDRTFTREFADGFQDGYADQLQRGGPPRPPAVPPLKYRRSRYFTPEGSLRVKDYLCGARYGAEVAAATGYRQFLTVPAMVGDSQTPQPLQITVLPPPPDPDKEPAAGEVKPAVPLPTGPKPAPVPLDPTPAPDPKTSKADGGLNLPPVTQPIVPKVEPARPDPLPLTPRDAVPVPKFDDLPPGSPKTAPPPPRPSPLRPGETGTGLPAIDLPFPDFLAPPKGANPLPPAGVVLPQGGTAEPGGVIPAAAATPAPAPPAVTPPPMPELPPVADGPPKPRTPAEAPPKPRPPADGPAR